MGNEDYLPALTLAPATPKLLMEFDEINGSLILVCPAGILDLS